MCCGSQCCTWASIPLKGGDNSLSFFPSPSRLLSSLVVFNFFGGAENAGPENAGPKNAGTMMSSLRDQNAVLENAGPENAGPDNAGLENAGPKMQG